jgi:HAD superfamily hydrolase (TIGR01509 family)
MPARRYPVLAAKPTRSAKRIDAPRATGRLDAVAPECRRPRNRFAAIMATRMRNTRDILAVLFDWDGTLIDSWSADANAYLAMFGIFGIPWGMAEFERHYSPNWHRIYRAAAIPRHRWPEADAHWLRAYRKYQIHLLPGARRILETLRGQYKLGLVTSGHRDRVQPQLRLHKVTSFFAARVFCEDAARRKPDPAALRVVMACLRVDAAACVYVGDSPEDIEMAHRAGMRAVAVLGPSPTRRTVAAALPDGLLWSLAELPAWLREQT